MTFAIAALCAGGGCRQILGVDDLPALRDGPPDDDAPADAPPDAMAGIDATPPIDARFCGASYVILQIDGMPSTSTYRLHGHQNWTNARDNCAGDGAHLVVIDDADEAAAVAAFADAESETSPYIWTGVFDDPATPIDNDFVTVLGTPASYTPWGAMQPTGGNDNCILVDDKLMPPYEMFDWTCVTPYKYVCECPP